MPLFIDRHDWPESDRSVEEIERRHMRDLAAQERHGVRYITAFVDVDRHQTFCIVEGPSKEACEAVHLEAHGAAAGRIIEIDRAVLVEFFGQLQELFTGDLCYGSALRTILFTDIEGSTALYQRLGDAEAVRVRRAHDEIVGSAIEATAGRVIKHTGDGIMACFRSVSRAVECAVRIQREICERASSDDLPVRVRVGLNAGEPVAEGDDLFGAAVNLAKRICDAAGPGSIVASAAVRDLAIGKDFEWNDAGRVPLKGFDDPVQLFELVWTNS